LIRVFQPPGLVQQLARTSGKITALRCQAQRGAAPAQEQGIAKMRLDPGQRG
jgi:hypothetical protein